MNGNVDDLRQLIQDLVSPDLKALTVRIDALRKEIRWRFDQAGKVELERFAAAEKMAALRHETALAVASANHALIMNAIDMDNRLARFERAKVQTSAHIAVLQAVAVEWQHPQGEVQYAAIVFIRH